MASTAAAPSFPRPSRLLIGGGLVCRRPPRSLPAVAAAHWPAASPFAGAGRDRRRPRPRLRPHAPSLFVRARGPPGGPPIAAGDGPVRLPASSSAAMSRWPLASRRALSPSCGLTCGDGDDVPLPPLWPQPRRASPRSSRWPLRPRPQRRRAHSPRPVVNGAARQPHGRSLLPFPRPFRLPACVVGGPAAWFPPWMGGPSHLLPCLARNARRRGLRGACSRCSWRAVFLRAPWRHLHAPQLLAHARLRSVSSRHSRSHLAAVLPRVLCGAAHGLASARSPLLHPTRPRAARLLPS